ncbi:hypothetical protein MRX96_021234 [Rhipicephalus microplus]
MPLPGPTEEELTVASGFISCRVHVDDVPELCHAQSNEFKTRVSQKSGHIATCRLASFTERKAIKSRAVERGNLKVKRSTESTGPAMLAALCNKKHTCLQQPSAMVLPDPTHMILPKMKKREGCN